MEPVRVSPAEETSQPFYEHRAFKGAAAVVALITALIALAGPIGNAVDNLSPNPPERTAWVQVVLDTSVAMGQGFGDGEKTRLEAAVSAVEKAVKELDNSGVGLRGTSTSCGGESKPLVDLANGDSQEVIDAAAEQHPGGDASIVDAILGGLDEFNREPMQSHGPESRRLFVFTTSNRSCPWDDPTGEVQRKLEEAHHGRFGSVEVFALTSGGGEPARATPSGGSQTQMVALETVAASGGELDALETLLGPKARIHRVTSPAELYEQAEEAGEGAREAAEQIERVEEMDGLESGTSDEGGQQ